MSQSLVRLKMLALIFTVDAVYDNKIEVGLPVQPFDSEHPLLTDRGRLEKITDIMYAKIQKTLFSENSGRRQTAKTERVLDGTAVSADDVLSEALIGLLQYPPEHLEGTWEALAVRIARNKAIDSLRASQKGLRATEHRPQLRLVSGDAEIEGPGGEIKPSLLKKLPSNWGDPEAEYLELEKALELRNLAREVLDERAREIFFAIHFDGESRTEVGRRLGLTSQRVGQIYHAALHSLVSEPGNPFKPDN